jgi:hypothetical protein
MSPIRIVSSSVSEGIIWERMGGRQLVTYCKYDCLFHDQMNCCGRNCTLGAKQRRSEFSGELAVRFAGWEINPDKSA